MNSPFDFLAKETEEEDNFIFQSPAKGLSFDFILD